jgi:MFS family permease
MTVMLATFMEVLDTSVANVALPHIAGKREKHGMAMAVYAMGVVVAPTIGPTLGGWLTDNYSWRWVV